MRNVVKKLIGIKTNRLEVTDGENGSIIISSKGTKICCIDYGALKELYPEVHGWVSTSACEQLKAYLLQHVNKLTNEQQTLCLGQQSMHRINVVYSDDDDVKIHFNGIPWRQTDESDNNRQQCNDSSICQSSDSDL